MNTYIVTDYRKTDQKLIKTPCHYGNQQYCITQDQSFCRILNKLPDHVSNNVNFMQLKLTIEKLSLH
jgi:hypothetical protein